MNNRVMISLFLLGLSFGMGPCLVSCGPLLICYIAGTGKNIRRAIVAYLLFSSARILAYLVAGIFFFFLGRILAARFVYIAGGIFIVTTGVAIAFEKKLEFPHFKTNIFIFGLIVGLIPCGPLLSLATYIGLVSKSWLQSLIYSLSFGIGTFISPLILLAIFAGAIPQFILAKKQLFRRIFNFICGAIIIFLGIHLIIIGAIKNA